MALVNKKLSEILWHLASFSSTDRMHIIHNNAGSWESYYVTYAELSAAILTGVTNSASVLDLTLTSGVEYSYSDSTYNQLILAVIFEPASGTLKIYDGVNTYKEDNKDVNTTLNLYLPKTYNLKFKYTGSGTATCKLIIFKWA